MCFPNDTSSAILFSFSLQLIIFKEDSSSFEYRIQSLTEEVETLRKSVVEKDTTISKLRIEMRESADKMSRISSFVCACTHSELLFFLQLQSFWLNLKLFYFILFS